MYTKALAKFSIDTKYENLDQATVAMVKQSFLDWFGCCIRGSKEAQGEIMRRVLALQGQPTAKVTTVFTSVPFRTSSLDATLSNGCASHALDFDDLHNASIVHTGVAIIPAAIAEAEKLGASGKELITAIVVGFEVADRIGECVNPEAYFYHHTTGTAGTFGAAAAVANLLKLNVEQSVNALGIAGTQAAANFEWVANGANTKALHSGKSNYNGMLSAYLAKEGFTGASTILEGKQGFCRAMSPAPKFEKLIDGLGHNFKINENAFKYYPFCKHSHSSVLAATKIKDANHLSSQQVASVTAKVNSQADVYINHPAPKTGYDAKFSLQYCLAAALCYDQVTVETFSAQTMQDKELQRLTQAVTVCIDPAIDEEYTRCPGKWAAEVTIKTFDGQEYVQYLPYPLGDPQNPVSYEQTEEKFRTLAAPVFDTPTVEKLLQLVRNMENIDNMSKALSFLTDNR